MDDLEVEFDFEDDLNADVGQPVEAPQSMSDRSKKNYRQVRGERERDRESDPLIRAVGGKLFSFLFFFQP